MIVTIVANCYVTYRGHLSKVNLFPLLIMKTHKGISPRALNLDIKWGPVGCVS